MDTVHEEGNELSIDTLASLEVRIQRAVELLTALRGENLQLAEQASQAQAERDASVAEAAQMRRQLTAAETHAGKLAEELNALRGERKQVKTRIEKLLGQMDLIGTS